MAGIRSDYGIVQLGRAGDIVNMLPIAQHIHRRLGRTVCVVVHKQYWNDFQGQIQGVDVVPFDGEITDVREAMYFARGFCREVLTTQVYGNNNAERRLDSFAVDSWRLVGYEHLWDSLPLALEATKDQAQSVRADFARAMGRSIGSSPIVMFCGGGHSSPTPRWADFASRMASAISNRMPGAVMIEVGNYRAKRFMDMAYVLGMASLLVCADTSILHLGAFAVAPSGESVRVPTLALTTDKPTLWHGTKPKSHWIGRERYSTMDALIESVRIGRTTLPNVGG